MADKSLVAKLILDTSSYQKAVQIARGETQTIKKELELWQIQNKTTSDSLAGLSQEAKANADMQKILGAQIQKTEETYKAAVAEQGENSKSAITLRNKLLDLQIQQAKLNNEVGGGLTPMQNFKNYMGALGENLQATGEKIANVGKGMTTYITGPALAAGAGIIALATSTSEYADEIGVMSEKTGMSQKSLQELKYVTNQLDMDFSAIEASSVKFTSSLKSADKESSGVSLTLDKLGISTKNANGQTRASSDMYMEAIDKLSKMKNQTDRNVMASQLFGKQYSELIPLLNAGSGETKKLAAEAEKLGLVMSDKAVSDARSFGDQMDSLKAQMAGVGRQVASDLIPVLTGTLIPFIQEKVIPAVTKFAGHIAGLITWFEGLNPTVQKVIGVVAGLVVAAGPVVMIIGNVVKGVGLLTSAIKGGISVFTALASPVTLIVIGVAALAAGVYLLVKNWDKAVPFFQGVWGVIKAAFETGTSGAMVGIRYLQLGLAKLIDFIYGNLLGAISTMLGVFSKIPMVGDMFKTAQAGVDYLRNGIHSLVTSSEKDLATAQGNLKEAAANTKESWAQMTDAAKALGKGMGDTVKDAVDKVKNIFKSTPKAAEETTPDMEKAGQDTGDAYADGLDNSSDKVEQSAEDLVKLAAEAAQKAKDDAIKSINSLNSAVLAALKRRYDAQKKLDTDALEVESKNLEAWKDTQLKSINSVHDAAIKALDKETASKVAAVQAQIDAIDAQQAAEEKAKQNKQELDNIAELQAKLAAAETADDRLSIQKDLDQALQDRADRIHQDEVDALKDSLSKQIDAIRSASDDKKAQLDAELDAQQEALDTQYNAEKDNLEKRKANIEKYYSDVESAAKLNAEAQKIIMGNNASEIADLLKTYGDQYEDSGKSLGERFFDGFKSWAEQIGQIIQDATIAATYAKVSTSGATSSPVTVNPGIQRIMAYDVGTPYVPQDGLAYIHKGEAVIPADRNRGNFGTQTANIYVQLDGKTIAAAVGQPLVDMIRVKTGLKI